MGLPDMRTNRTSDRFAALADTVTCNAKYRFAIGAGKQHLLRPFHTSQPLYTSVAYHSVLLIVARKPDAEKGPCYPGFSGFHKRSAGSVLSCIEFWLIGEDVRTCRLT